MTNTELTTWTGPEESFLAVLLRDRKESPSIVIPDNMPAEAVLSAVDRCTSVLVKLGKGEAFIVPVLGRLMALVAAGKLWEGAGYKSLAEYERKEIEGKGVAHSTLWQAKQAFEVFPDLPLEQYAEIGPKKLAIAAKVCEGKSPKQKKKVLGQAATLTLEALRHELENNSGLSGPGETSGAMFELYGSKAEIDELKEHLAEPQFTVFAGDDRPIGKVLAAIQESRDLWPKPTPQPKIHGALPVDSEF